MARYTLSARHVVASFAGIVVSALLYGCNTGNGLAVLPPVTPAQQATITSHVKATVFYVQLHPLDAPDVTLLRQLRDQWHAGGVRIDYIPGSEAFYDGLVANAKALGLKLAFITPYTTAPFDTSGYASLVANAVKRYAGNGITWEIYNEPDLITAKFPTFGVADYIALAKSAAAAIRANDSSATILTGGTSGKDSPHFTFAMAAGKALAPYVDGVAIHPYGVDYNSFGSAVAEVTTATGATVYVTEWGNDGGRGLGQAMLSAKGLTPMFCAYEYKEQPSEVAAGNSTWGLTDSGAWTQFAAAAAQ